MAKRGTEPEEPELLHRPITSTEDERNRLVVEFLDSAFDGVNCEFDEIARTLTRNCRTTPNRN